MTTNAKPTTDLLLRTGTYTVYFSRRYGVDKEYRARHEVTLDAASGDEAIKLAWLSFPASWHMEFTGILYHKHAGRLCEQRQP